MLYGLEYYCDTKMTAYKNEYNLQFPAVKTPFRFFFYNSSLILFSGFRLEFLHALEGPCSSSSRGLFINSCYVHCQSVTQETWLSNDSFVLGGKVSELFPLSLFFFFHVAFLFLELPKTEILKTFSRFLVVFISFLFETNFCVRIENFFLAFRNGDLFLFHMLSVCNWEGESRNGNTCIFWLLKKDNNSGQLANINKWDFLKFYMKVIRQISCVFHYYFLTN